MGPIPEQIGHWRVRGRKLAAFRRFAAGKNCSFSPTGEANISVARIISFGAQSWKKVAKAL